MAVPSGSPTAASCAAPATPEPCYQARIQDGRIEARDFT
jgi:hypothetical protein